MTTLRAPFSSYVLRHSSYSQLIHAHQPRPCFSPVCLVCLARGAEEILQDGRSLSRVELRTQPHLLQGPWPFDSSQTLGEFQPMTRAAVFFVRLSPLQELGERCSGPYIRICWRKEGWTTPLHCYRNDQAGSQEEPRGHRRASASLPLVARHRGPDFPTLPPGGQAIAA